MRTNVVKISSRQVFWLLVVAEIIPVGLFLRQPISVAGQDAWIATLVSGLVGIVITFIIVQVSLLYPHATVVEYVQEILGKWIGEFIIFMYMLLGLPSLALMLRQDIDYVHVVLFERTPLWVPMICIVLLMMYITYCTAIEGIARCAELVGPPIVIMLFVLIALSWPYFDIHLILPVYTDSGWQQILKGALPTAPFFGQSLVLGMLLSSTVRPKEVRSSAILAVICCTLISTILIIAAIIEFDPVLAGRLLYPGLEMNRFLSVMNFLQNVESVGVTLWIMGCFLQLSMHLFVLSYAAGLWLRLKDWRKTVWVIAPLTFVLAWLPRTSSFASVAILKAYWVSAVMLTAMIGVPLVLWAVASFRTRTTARITK